MIWWLDKTVSDCDDHFSVPIIKSEVNSKSGNIKWCFIKTSIDFIQQFVITLEWISYNMYNIRRLLTKTDDYHIINYMADYQCTDGMLMIRLSHSKIA